MKTCLFVCRRPYVGKTIALSLLFASSLRLVMVSAMSLQEVTYDQARLVRLQEGHSAAMPLYQECLESRNRCKHNPHQDWTAATRIAASPETPYRHDAACRLDACLDGGDRVQDLQSLLKDSGYTTHNIQRLLRVPESKWASAPIYIRPCRAGDTRTVPSIAIPSQESGTQQSSLECLVALFLLGLAAPRQTLSRCLLGGQESIELLEHFGLAFQCSVDSSLVVPYVHIMPLTRMLESEDAATAANPLYLVTDLHPSVLSATTVGTRNEGAVMYIGPDSLALVQHMEPWLDTWYATSTRAREHQEDRSLSVLDVCTGSGIQALAVLSRFPHAQALCVDVNERALRFVKFNAALNGMSERVRVLQGDLIQSVGQGGDAGETTVDLLQCIRRAWHQDLGHSRLALFDLIVANPPFIPVPPDDDIIRKRYGLFSSGGTSGEEVLEGVVRLAAKLLVESGGILGVVSEYMNPPRRDVGSMDEEGKEVEGTELLNRLQEWWKSSSDAAAIAILLTNEIPVEASVYATRRAESESEKELWERHLGLLGITHVSPGLLFAYTTTSGDALPSPSRLTKVQHSLIPKTSAGSVWTPSNGDAINFTRTSVMENLFQC